MARISTHVRSRTHTHTERALFVRDSTQSPSAQTLKFSVTILLESPVSSRLHFLSTLKSLHPWFHRLIFLVMYSNCLHLRRLTPAIMLDAQLLLLPQRVPYTEHTGGHDIHAPLHGRFKRRLSPYLIEKTARIYPSNCSSLAGS
jgi:hypothetical protein